MQRRGMLLAACGASLLGTLRAAAAEGPGAAGWPDHPVRFVVPYSPGGSTDVTGRLVAAELSDRLGQPFVADNRPGAGGNIGAEQVARAAPDGYTLLFTTSSLPTNMALYRHLPFDVLRDFVPVSQTAFVPNLLVVPNSLPVHSVAELIALAKAKPGALNYGTSGTGTSQHLSSALFCARAGIEATHVPYRGGAPANTDLLAGKLDFIFAPLIEVIGFVQAKELRPLAVTTRRRSALLPDVPTVAETLPGFEVALWNGVFAPAGTPAPIVSRLAEAVQAAVRSPAMRGKFAEQGSEPVGSTPEEFAAFFRAEVPKWAELVRISGAHAD